MGLIFHRLVKQDLKTVMNHYEEEGGPDLVARFQREFEELAVRIEQNPRRFHFVSGALRRANFPSFPYHLLYRESERGASILVREEISAQCGHDVSRLAEMLRGKEAQYGGRLARLLVVRRTKPDAPGKLHEKPPPYGRQSGAG